MRGCARAAGRRLALFVRHHLTTVCESHPSVSIRVVCLLALLAIAGLGSAEDCVTEAPQTVNGMTAEFESCAAVIDEVISANSEGYRFIAYAAKWKGQRVIVSDFNGESDFVVGDHIFFTVMKSPPLNKTATGRKHISFFFTGGYPASSRGKP